MPNFQAPMTNQTAKGNAQSRLRRDGKRFGHCRLVIVV
jgi:hypothetical protein